MNFANFIFRLVKISPRLDAYILLKGTITVVGGKAIKAAKAGDRNNRQEVLKKCAPFTELKNIVMII